MPIPAGKRCPDAGPRTPDDLLRSSATGDQRAFALLYDQLVIAVLATIRAILLDRSQTEEVAQEVFLQIWREAPRYRPDKGSVITWARVIARRRAIDRVRSAQASSRRDHADSLNTTRSPGIDVVACTAIDLDTGRHLRNCLAQLSDVQRIAIELAYYQDHTTNEIAGALQVPAGTIKTRLRDGKIRLRLLLDELENPDSADSSTTPVAPSPARTCSSPVTPAPPRRSHPRPAVPRCP